jgi:hypothetical protein
MNVVQLPVTGEQRVRLIELSNSSFKSAARRINSVRKVKSEWNAESYLDKFASRMELPMDEDCLGGLIEATMIHHVMSLLPKVR